MDYQVCALGCCSEGVLSCEPSKCSSDKICNPKGQDGACNHGHHPEADQHSLGWVVLHVVHDRSSGRVPGRADEPEEPSTVPGWVGPVQGVAC